MLDNTNLQMMSRSAIARRIAIVPQETHLAFEYTVLEMAVMGRYPHLAAFEIEGPGDLEIARNALRVTGTLHLESRLFSTLSGGEMVDFPASFLPKKICFLCKLVNLVSSNFP